MARTGAKDRRSQTAIRRESLLFAFGGVLVVLGVVLVAFAVLDDTRASREAQNPPPTVAAAPESSTTTTPTTAAPARTITIAATGGIYLHQQVSEAAAEYGDASDAAYDYGPMFFGIAPVVSGADLALCHLETPLAATSAGVRTGDTFVVPAEITNAIAGAGYEGCSTASTRSLDGGDDGVVTTIEKLDASGLGHAGTARTAEEAATPRVYSTPAGVSVAHLAYTDSLGGDELPEGGEHLVNLIDPARILADAEAARAAGVDVVVVSLHWGEEFESDPTAEQLAVAEALGASPDIDVVIGHGAHVVQPVTKVGNVVVAYGLGNLLSNQGEGDCCPAASQDGVVLEFVIIETAPGSGEFEVTEVRYTPTWVENETYAILPVATALAGPEREETDRDTLTESQQRTDEAIARLGQLATPSGK